MLTMLSIQSKQAPTPVCVLKMIANGAELKTQQENGKVTISVAEEAGKYVKKIIIFPEDVEEILTAGEKMIDEDSGLSLSGKELIRKSIIFMKNEGLR